MFQVSTPALLKDLRTSAELREATGQYAKQVVEAAAEAHVLTRKYEKISDRALDELAQRHPELAKKLEEASGIGNDKSAILHELKLVLSDLPTDQQNTLVKEYSGILDDLLLSALKETSGLAARASQYLSVFEIDFWKQGTAFYVGAGALTNWIGVLITTIALALGAPFWFNILQTVIGLRDALKPTPRAGGPRVLHD